ncbi:Retrovirus-related Pol polyprotein from transposon TNT 1-94-like protein [Drosera capensis]
MYYILNTLPQQYAPFKISYNTHKSNWSINKLMTICVQEEQRLLMESRESVHLTTLGKAKEQGKKKGKGKLPVEADIKKQSKCFFCRKEGHLKKDSVRSPGGLTLPVAQDVPQEHIDETLRRSIRIKKSAIPEEWNFKTKKDSLGNIKRYKTRLVVKGFTQKEGSNYNETFAPITKKNSLCIILALVVYFDMELHQMDAKTTFLNEYLEEVYMKQPERFLSGEGEHLVCKLKKSIYGLKQASDQWYLKFHDVISSFRFVENIKDAYVYQKIYFLMLYVDDILLASNDKDCYMM